MIFYSVLTKVCERLEHSSVMIQFINTFFSNDTVYKYVINVSWVFLKKKCFLCPDIKLFNLQDIKK